MFWVNRNLNRIALRYVTKIQVRLNGGHFPYLASVALWPVSPSHVIPVRETRKQNRNNNYISSPLLFRPGKTLQKSLKVCHKNPRETKWRSYSLYIQRDPLSGITFRRNTGQRDKVYAQKLYDLIRYNSIQECFPNEALNGYGIKQRGLIVKDFFLWKGGLIRERGACYYWFFASQMSQKSEQCFHCLQYNNPIYGLFYILLGAALCHVNV